MLSFVDINFRHDILMTACIFVVSSGHFVFNLCRARFTLHFVALYNLSYDIDTILYLFLEICAGSDRKTS